MTSLPFRQVHLDFHTSPHIPDVGIDFDPQEFVHTLQGGHVNSVTVFAKCHHGYSYYPTNIGTSHPNLQRPDLLGEMIEACHRAGVRIPIYTTVVWDELAWATHPEWRQLSPDGCICGPAGSVFEPGWKNLCMNTGYADYVTAQIEEILDLYDGDGLFVDIVTYFGQGCVCAMCLDRMMTQGIDPTDPAQLQQFALDNERRFMRRVTDVVWAKKPEHRVFFNSRLRMAWNPQLGNRPEMNDFTHLEIESLPGGFWGYDHFPMYVRYFQTFEKELLAMTGRFHTTWGDFGGLRNRVALEFECFQALAHGAGCSIGDQLPPRGRLDPTVYRRIGEVYAEVERREAWCVDTQPLPEIGVFTTATFPTEHHPLVESDRGVLHILEQLKYQFQFLDAGSDLSPYVVIIMPDEVPVDDALASKLRDFVRAGGRLLITGRSGLDEPAGDFVLAQEMGVHYSGEAEFAPDYLVLEPGLTDGIESMNQVCELPGMRVNIEPGVEVLARSGAPYFNRTWQLFCSHQYTPMDKVTDEPVIAQNNNIIYIARPLFREYAESARLIHKKVIGNCLQRLLPRPRVGAHNLPSTAIVTVRQQNHDLLLHLLHYVHQRRGQSLDIIEDVIPLHNVEVSIRAEQAPAAVQLVPEQQPVAWTWVDDYVRLTVPQVNGYQIVQLVGAA